MECLEERIGIFRLLFISLLGVILVNGTAWAGNEETDTYEDQSGHYDGLHTALPLTYPMGYAGFVPGVTYPLTGNHPGVLVPDSENVFDIYGHGTGDQVEYGWSVVMDPSTPGSGADFTILDPWEEYAATHSIFGHEAYPVAFPETVGGQHVGPGYESSDCSLWQYCWKTAAPPSILDTDGHASGLGSDPQTGYDFIDPAYNALVGPYSGFEYSDPDNLGYEPEAADDPDNPSVLNSVLEAYERIHTQNFLVQNDAKFIDDMFSYVPWAEGTDGSGLNLNVITLDSSTMPINSTATVTASMQYDPLASFERIYSFDIFRAWDHTQDTNVTRDWGCDTNAVSDPKDCLIAAPDGKTDEKFELYETRKLEFAFITSSHSLEQKWYLFDITIHDEGLADHILTDAPADDDPLTGRNDGTGPCTLSDPTGCLYWYADYVRYAVHQSHKQKMEDWGTFPESGKNFDVISAMKYVVVHDKSPIYSEIDPNRRLDAFYTSIPLVHNEFGGHGAVVSVQYDPTVAVALHNP
ncbi:MAG: hypothetical protein HZA19_00745 [Nitrospirae bacterium]|nr:hypothetical protein [Nitrospirota bacterium]